MADPLTIAAAIASIPGTFVACVDCFQYIRLGKRFGKDFGVCLAKLEAAHMQLTRWGEPLGLLENKFDTKGAYSDADVIHANEWLGLILSAFQEAGEISAKYAERQKKKEKHQDLELLNAETDLESNPSMKQLYLSIKGVTTARQKHLSFPRKVTWALYGKDDLTELIENLVNLINNLEKLFPSNKPRLQELGKQEVANLGKEIVLDLAELLKNDNEKLDHTDDPILREAIREHIDRHSLEFDDVKIDGKIGEVTHLGDDYARGSKQAAGNLHIKKLDIKGEGNTRAGHTFQ
jgi:Prion-inhibition and propagation